MSTYTLIDCFREIAIGPNKFFLRQKNLKYFITITSGINGTNLGMYFYHHASITQLVG